MYRRWDTEGKRKGKDRVLVTEERPRKDERGTGERQGERHRK